MENPDPAAPPINQDPPAPPAPSQEFTWKSNLNPDFANSPTMKLFPDTKEGFNNAVKSHLELQKLMADEEMMIEAQLRAR